MAHKNKSVELECARRGLFEATKVRESLGYTYAEAILAEATAIVRLATAVQNMPTKRKH